MEHLVRVFLKIISTVHQRITGDDEANYRRDFDYMLIPFDESLFDTFERTANSVAILFLQGTLRCLTQAYADVAFCMRFQLPCEFNGLDLRHLSSRIQAIPQSYGGPTFLVGTEEDVDGVVWNRIIPQTDPFTVRITPLVEYNRFCIYYGETYKENQTTPE